MVDAAAGVVLFCYRAAVPFLMNGSLLKLIGTRAHFSRHQLFDFVSQNNATPLSSQELRGARTTQSNHDSGKSAGKSNPSVSTTLGVAMATRRR